jgi:hypothetical protein
MTSVVQPIALRIQPKGPSRVSGAPARNWTKTLPGNCLLSPSRIASSSICW